MLTLSYILESSLDQLKPLLVKGVKSRIDDYELEKDLLPYFKKVGKELIFLVYDPILVVGNPADNYNIHLKENEFRHQVGFCKKFRLYSSFLILLKKESM